jgi:hypothetical protein
VLLEHLEFQELQVELDYQDKMVRLDNQDNQDQLEHLEEPDLSDLSAPLVHQAFQDHLEH